MQTQRSSEVTLVPSFGSLQLRRFELEFSVDPLFKKASADFDEGGAKGLLLNHLTIDERGRIKFDSSDDSEFQADDASSDVKRHSNDYSAISDECANNAEPVYPEYSQQFQVVDVESLRVRFFPSLNLLDDQDVCPSLKSFDLGDPTSTLDIPYLKEAEGHDQLEGECDQETPVGASRSFNDHISDESNTGDKIAIDADFGEGGEIWARDVSLEPYDRHDREDGPYQVDLHGSDHLGSSPKVAGTEQNRYGTTMRRTTAENEDILSYFDNTVGKNWAGPEHWKIRRMKDYERLNTVTSRRRDKEVFQIDFLQSVANPMAHLIYTYASTNSSISIPKAMQKSKSRNLLPDDKHFNSKQLLGLFLKPRARLSRLNRTIRRHPNIRCALGSVQDTDQAFWAHHSKSKEDAQSDGSPQVDYNANFFQDDPVLPLGMPEDDDEFADAREAFSPSEELETNHHEGVGDFPTPGTRDGQGFGAQLVTKSNRSRPEYVQYAKIAKKVDVRRLKEEIWRGIGDSGVMCRFIHRSTTC